MGKEKIEETDRRLVWESRPANEWLRAAAEMPEPKKLFGECWLEGEVALMYGDTGKGKSLLAIQIAEAIARGESVAPMENQAEAQKVLVVDVELSAKQFGMRYAARDGSGHHEFSPNFTRTAANLPFAGGDIAQGFCDKIRELLLASGAKVLIVDHITAVRCSQYGIAAVAGLLGRLRQMRDEMSLSVLVLAQSPKREMHRPVSINDLGALKHFGSMADSIFALGQSRNDAELRYLKQIKARSTSIVYGEENVAIFRLAKLDGRFLGFEFEMTDREEGHISRQSGTVPAKLIAEMQGLTDGGGRSVRSPSISIRQRRGSTGFCYWHRPSEKPRKRAR